MIAIKNILVATDFSEVSNAALSYGRTLAGYFDAALHVVHVVEDIALRNIGADGFVGMMPELQRAVEETARQRLDEQLPRQASEPRPDARIIAANAPAEAIVSYARDTDVDLIVIGTQGRGGMSRLFLGSVAERVVRLAPCPVLTVHHPEHEFVRPDATRSAA